MRYDPRVIPWVLLASTPAPAGGGTLNLYQRDDEYSIRAGGTELMNSRLHASEDALAELTCERLRSRTGVRILLGGLGMGFTLTSVMQKVDRTSEIVVAELVPAVVEWNRTILGHLNGNALKDARVRVVEKDVAKVIRTESGGYDAIVLDVDSGPAGHTAKSTDRLYGNGGLRAAELALRPGGILTIWSAQPDPKFTKRLEQTGFKAEVLTVRGRDKTRGPKYTIWIAKRR